MNFSNQIIQNLNKLVEEGLFNKKSDLENTGNTSISPKNIGNKIKNVKILSAGLKIHNYISILPKNEKLRITERKRDKQIWFFSFSFLILHF